MRRVSYDLSDSGLKLVVFSRISGKKDGKIEQVSLALDEVYDLLQEIIINKKNITVRAKASGNLISDQVYYE